MVNPAVINLAPTTLPGQRTTTTPLGRGRLEGAPLRMAEMIAQLDGPVYVERVALYDARVLYGWRLSGH